MIDPWQQIGVPLHQAPVVLQRFTQPGHKIRDVHGICRNMRKCLSSHCELPFSSGSSGKIFISVMQSVQNPSESVLSLSAVNPRRIGKFLWLQFRCRSHLNQSTQPRNMEKHHWINSSWAAQQLVNPRISSTPPSEAPTSSSSSVRKELRRIQKGTKRNGLKIRSHRYHQIFMVI